MLLDENWYRKIKKGETWIKKVSNKNYYNEVKIISVVNKKKMKYIKLEFPNKKRFTAEPEWLFYNYKKK